MVSVLHAGHHYLRGFARLGLSVLDSYPEPAMAQLAARRAELVRLVDSMTCDGTFVVAFDRKESER
jgi:hypothetical protein